MQYSITFDQPDASSISPRSLSAHTIDREKKKERKHLFELVNAFVH